MTLSIKTVLKQILFFHVLRFIIALAKKVELKSIVHVHVQTFYSGYREIDSCKE